MFDGRWWEKEIDHDTAITFLNECHDNYQNYVTRHAPNLARYENNHHRYNFRTDFIPCGAIIHPTNTMSLLDTFRAIARGVYGTQFVIARRQTNKTGPLSEQVPCTIFAPMSLEYASPHAGYLSDLTWGIDLQLAGLLRVCQAEKRPQRIYRESFKPYTISNTYLLDHGYAQNRGRKFYSYYDDWTEEYVETQRLGDDGYYYTTPLIDQVISLIALLRTLNAITPMRDSLIVPSSCVSTKIGPVLSNLDWEYIRSESRGIHAIDTAKFDLAKSPHAFNQTLTNTQEHQISDIVTENKWRADIDNEKLRTFNEVHIDWSRRNGMKNFQLEMSIRGAQKRIRTYLSKRGYSADVEQVETSFLMWHLAGSDTERVYDVQTSFEDLWRKADYNNR